MRLREEVVQGSATKSCKELGTSCQCICCREPFCTCELTCSLPSSLSSPGLATSRGVAPPTMSSHSKVYLACLQRGGWGAVSRDAAGSHSQGEPHTQHCGPCLVSFQTPVKLGRNHLALLLAWHFAPAAAFNLTLLPAGALQPAAAALSSYRQCFCPSKDGLLLSAFILLSRGLPWLVPWLGADPGVPPLSHGGCCLANFSCSVRLGRLQAHHAHGHARWEPPRTPATEYQAFWEHLVGLLACTFLPLWAWACWEGACQDNQCQQICVLLGGCTLCWLMCWTLVVLPIAPNPCSPSLSSCRRQGGRCSRAGGAAEDAERLERVQLHLQR